jgi:chromosome segregation ATPase
MGNNYGWQVIMTDKDKNPAYDIKDDVLNILLSVDDKSPEGREISGRRREYFDTGDKLNKYSEELRHKLHLLDSEGQRLKSLHGKLAVNEKGIAALKDEILLLKKNREMVDNPDIILEEFNRQEARLSELAEKEQVLEKDILQFERNLKEDFDEASVIASQLKVINSEIAEIKPLKAVLNEEVTRLNKVARVFVERDRIKSISEELDVTFTAQSAELDNLKEIISESRKSTPELRSTVISLEDRLDSLEKKAKAVRKLLNERDSLNADIEVLEPEHRSIIEKVEELQRELDDKQGTLEELSLANADKKNAITSIEEAIARSGDTVQEINRAKESLKESTMLNEQAVTELEGRLRNKMTIDSELFLMEEAVKTIIKSVEEKR